MRLPRFRLRTLMIVVAVVAIPMGLLLERQSRFIERSRYHGEQAGTVVFHFEDGGKRMIPIVTRRDGTKASYARHRWHDALMQKYALAARRPWLPVAPDPPEPK